MWPAIINYQVAPALATRAMAAGDVGERQGGMDELESLPLGSRVLGICLLRLETLMNDIVEDFAYRAWGFSNPALALADANCAELSFAPGI